MVLAMLVKIVSRALPIVERVVPVEMERAIAVKIVIRALLIVELVFAETERVRLPKTVLHVLLTVELAQENVAILSSLRVVAIRPL